MNLYLCTYITRACEICVHWDKHMHAHMHVCAHVDIPIHLHNNVRAHVHAHMHRHVHIHVHSTQSHIHIHIHLQPHMLMCTSMRRPMCVTVQARGMLAQGDCTAFAPIRSICGLGQSLKRQLGARCLPARAIGASGPRRVANNDLLEATAGGQGPQVSDFAVALELAQDDQTSAAAWTATDSTHMAETDSVMADLNHVVAKEPTALTRRAQATLTLPWRTHPCRPSPIPRHTRSASTWG